MCFKLSQEIIRQKTPTVLLFCFTLNGALRYITWLVDDSIFFWNTEKKQGSQSNASTFEEKAMIRTQQVDTVHKRGQKSHQQRQMKGS